MKRKNKSSGKNKRNRKNKPDLETLYYQSLELKKNIEEDRKQKVVENILKKKNNNILAETTLDIRQNNVPSLFRLIDLVKEVEKEKTNQIEEENENDSYNECYSDASDDNELDLKEIQVPKSLLKNDAFQHNPNISDTIRQEYLEGPCPNELHNDFNENEDIYISDTVSVQSFSEDIHSTETSNPKLPLRFTFQSFYTDNIHLDNAESQYDPKSIKKDTNLILRIPGYNEYKHLEENDAYILLKQQLDTLPEECIDFKDTLKSPYLLNDIHLSALVLKQWNKHIYPLLEKRFDHWNNMFEYCKTPNVTHPIKSIQASSFFRIISMYIDTIFTNIDYLSSLTYRSLVVLHCVNHLVNTYNNIETNKKRLINLVKTNAFDNTTQYRPVKSNKNKKQDIATDEDTGRVSQRVTNEDMAEDSKMVADENTDKVSEDVLDSSGDDRFRDQGFTQPRILILTPTMYHCKEYVNLFMKLCPNIKQIRYRTKFENKFSSEPGMDPQKKEEDENGSLLASQGKPADYCELFRGNNHDNFSIGIRLHKSGLTLHSPFYHSDIIIASPLGLLLMVGTKDSSNRCYDFLSSIELLIIDRIDVMKMQNWETLIDVLQVINQKPILWKNTCDIRRLRSMFLNGNFKNFRQTIALSHGRRPEIYSLFSSPRSIKIEHNSLYLSSNFRGYVKLVEPSNGQFTKRAACKVFKQLFVSIPCSSHHEIHTVLLQFFRTKFPPQFLLNKPNDKILLVVPSYLEYLQVKKALKESSKIKEYLRGIDHFRCCHEYSSKSMLSKSRQMFHSDETNLLIITERFLFYKRYKIKGANHILFYSPPEYPEIYLECLSELNPKESISAILYTKYHLMQCEEIVGRNCVISLSNVPSTYSKIFVLDK